MSLTSEVEIVQNAPLGALSLWAFTTEFCGQKGNNTGPALPLTLLVLPMVFHEETLEAIRSRRFEGGLFTALAQHRGLGLELQERMQAMIPQTMDALNLSFASGLLTFSRKQGFLHPLRKTVPFHPEHEATRRIISGAERLGYWASTINTSRLCALLNIRY
jgi:hypothetical protein